MLKIFPVKDHSNSANLLFWCRTPRAPESLVMGICMWKSICQTLVHGLNMRVFKQKNLSFAEITIQLSFRMEHESNNLRIWFQTSSRIFFCAEENFPGRYWSGRTFSCFHEKMPRMTLAIHVYVTGMIVKSRPYSQRPFKLSHSAIWVSHTSEQMFYSSEWRVKLSVVNGIISQQDFCNKLLSWSGFTSLKLPRK